MKKIFNYLLVGALALIGVASLSGCNVKTERDLVTIQSLVGTTDSGEMYTPSVQNSRKSTWTPAYAESDISSLQYIVLFNGETNAKFTITANNSRKFSIEGFALSVTAMNEETALDSDILIKYENSDESKYVSLEGLQNTYINWEGQTAETATYDLYIPSDITDGIITVNYMIYDVSDIDTSTTGNGEIHRYWNKNLGEYNKIQFHRVSTNDMNWEFISNARETLTNGGYKFKLNTSEKISGLVVTATNDNDIYTLSSTGTIHYAYTYQYDETHSYSWTNKRDIIVSNLEITNTYSFESGNAEIVLNGNSNSEHIIFGTDVDYSKIIVKANGNNYEFNQDPDVKNQFWIYGIFSNYHGPATATIGGYTYSITF